MVQQFLPFFLPLVILFLAVLLLETRVSCLVYSSASFYSLAVLLFRKKQEAHHHVRNVSLSLPLSLCISVPSILWQSSNFKPETVQITT
jgi:hypothetical protein